MNKYLKLITRVVCRELCLSVDSLKTKNRKTELVKARYIIWNIANKYFLNLSIEEMAAFFDKDRCTVLHGVKTIEENICYDKNLKNIYNKIINILKLNPINEGFEQNLKLLKKKLMNNENITNNPMMDGYMIALIEENHFAIYEVINRKKPVKNELMKGLIDWYSLNVLKLNI